MALWSLRDEVERVARKYLLATRQAGEIYRYIETKNGQGNFVPEVSMDETDSPQTPPELLIILAALADEKCPIQTIAPKFTGRFNKGVDYVGDLKQFEREFFDDLAVIRFAIGQYGLPSNLKLSVHSGSDKFGLYPIIRKALQQTGAGIHLKTAGTTWLEELIGLCEAGGDGLASLKKFMLMHWSISMSSVLLTRVLSISTEIACRPLRKWLRGTAATLQVRFGTSQATPDSTPAFDSYCTFLLRSLPSRAIDLRTCSSRMQESSVSR